MSDREVFLARIAERQGPPPAAGPHPPPPPPDTVPEVRTRALDGIAPGDTEHLLAVFRDQAERVDAVVHQGDPSEAVTAVVREHDITTAVVSPEPAARQLVPALRAAGVSVDPPGLAAAAAADLGVTGSVGAIAATGSVVVDADRSGGRTTSLLPRVHLCVVDRAGLVAGTADVLRRPGRPLPAHRVLITGPSRTGDIEQILTLGAHGPVALHVLVVGSGDGTPDR
jgi:L-lactate dehydrogenase complex protein LldG